MKTQQNAVNEKTQNQMSAIGAWLAKAMWTVFLLPLSLAVKVVDFLTKRNHPIMAWLGFAATFCLTAFGMVFVLLSTIAYAIGVSFAVVIVASVIVALVFLVVVVILDLKIARN